MPRTCRKPCCLDLPQLPKNKPDVKPFVCNVESCGASFKFKSVLTLHHRQNHPNAKNIYIIESLKSQEEKVNRETPKDVQIVLKNVLSDHYFCLPENARFNCPFCPTTTTSPSMYQHLRLSHRNLSRWINPKVICSRCGSKVHGGSFYHHRKHGNCEKQLSIGYQ